MHNFSEQDRIPFGEHTLVTKLFGLCLMNWHSGCFYVTRLSNACDVRKRGGKRNVANWSRNSSGRNVGTWCRAPDERKSHQGVDVIWTLEEQAEVALKLAVIGGVQHVEIVAPTT